MNSIAENNRPPSQSQIAQMVAAYKQGITIQQYTILCLLARKPMYAVEIYDAIDMNPGTYRKIALKLLHSKLIKKKHKPAPQDGPGTSKSALYSLTARGKKMVTPRS